MVPKLKDSVGRLAIDTTTSKSRNERFRFQGSPQATPERTWELRACVMPAIVRDSLSEYAEHDLFKAQDEINANNGTKMIITKQMTFLFWIHVVAGKLSPYHPGRKRPKALHHRAASARHARRCGRGAQDNDRAQGPRQGALYHDR